LCFHIETVSQYQSEQAYAKNLLHDYQN